MLKSPGYALYIVHHGNLWVGSAQVIDMIGPGHALSVQSQPRHVAGEQGQPRPNLRAAGHSNSDVGTCLEVTASFDDYKAAHNLTEVFQTLVSKAGASPLGLRMKLF